MPNSELTLIIFKPDAVNRGLIGEILIRFERVGLKLVAFKMLHPSKDLADKHYQATPIDLERMGNNTLRDAQNLDDVKEKFNTIDPLKIGKVIKQWLIEYLNEGPVIAIVLEGYSAIKIARKLIGATLPSEALPGTIRGDYSHDNAILANALNRPMRNLIHASGNQAEAEYEINLWFNNSELNHYIRSDEQDLFGPIAPVNPKR